MTTPQPPAEAFARLGRWYAEVRERRGFTQELVARAAGLSESRVRQIERARYGPPPEDTRRRMEAALGLPRDSSGAVLADLPSGVDLADLPPITETDDTGAERVVYAGPVDPERLARAGEQLRARYLRSPA